MSTIYSEIHDFVIFLEDIEALSIVAENSILSHLKKDGSFKVNVNEDVNIKHISTTAHCYVVLKNTNNPKTLEIISNNLEKAFVFLDNHTWETNGIGSDNIYTLSFVSKFLSLYDYSQLKDSTLIRSLDNKIEKSINVLLTNNEKGELFHICSKNNGDKHYHAFLDYWAINALSQYNDKLLTKYNINNIDLESLADSDYFIRINKFLDSFKLELEQKIMRQISLFNIRDFNYDSTQLAYWLCALNKIDSKIAFRYVEPSLNCIFDDLSDNYGWKSTFPIYYHSSLPKANVLTPYEPLNVLVETFKYSKFLLNYWDKITKTFNWIKNGYFKSKDFGIGWSITNSREDDRKAMSWANAIVYNILTNLSDLISNEIQSKLYSKYHLFDKYDHKISVSDYKFCNDLESFIKNLCSNYKEKGSNFSLLLFGPPGTGKTTYGPIIAQLTDLPYLYLGVNTFLNHGYNEITKSLNEILLILQCIKPKVIFLDEIDEFIRSRKNKNINDKSTNKYPTSPQPSQFTKLLTTNMLTLLNSIRNESNSILICATNNIKFVDKAIMRVGRFDYCVCVGPFDFKSRAEFFKSFLPKTLHKTSELDSLITETNGMIFGELKKLENSWKKQKLKSIDDLLVILHDNFGNPILSKDDLKEYYQEYFKFDNTPRSKDVTNEKSFFYKDWKQIRDYPEFDI